LREERRGGIGKSVSRRTIPGAKPSHATAMPADLRSSTLTEGRQLLPVNCAGAGSPEGHHCSRCCCDFATSRVTKSLFRNVFRGRNVDPHRFHVEIPCVVVRCRSTGPRIPFSWSLTACDRGRKEAPANSRGKLSLAGARRKSQPVRCVHFARRSLRARRAGCYSRKLNRQFDKNLFG
jgi:hypothetical protein